MTLPAPVPRARFAAALIAFAFALGAAALGDATLAGDAGRAPPSLVAIGRFVTGFGTSEYMFAFSALIALVAIVAMGRGHRTWHGGSLRLIAERALYFFAVVAVSGILAQVIKHIVGRARPVLLAADGAYHFEFFSIRNALASFPSGHTTSAFAAAVALGYMRPDWRRWLLAGAVAIGVSRVLVGAHYPSDVVGGATLGSVVALAMARSFALRGIAFTARGGRTVMKPLRRGADGAPRAPADAGDLSCRPAAGRSRRRGRP